MTVIRIQEAILQQLKRLEQFYYQSEYQKLAETLRSLEGVGWDKYRESLEIPTPEKIKSILIFKPDEIGDAIFSLPAIAKLREHYSGAKFFLICQKATSSIYERTGFFDEISAIEVKKVFLRFPVLSIKDVLKKFSIQHFDISIFLRTYPSYFQHFLKVSANHKVHPLDPRMKSSGLKAPVSLWGDKREYQAHQLLEMAAFLTGERYSTAEIKFPAFNWNEEDKKALNIAFGSHAPARFMVIHPFARYETRRYPMKHWISILAWLKNKFPMPILVIGGKEDGNFPGIPGSLQLQGRLSLTQSGYLLSQASAFLGNESGPAHLSAAMGVPTVTFFGGHSLPEEWGPLGNTLLLSSPVSCSPCHRRVCPGYGVKCLHDLSPEKVLPELESFLSAAI